MQINKTICDCCYKEKKDEDFIQIMKKDLCAECTKALLLKYIQPKINTEVLEKWISEIKPSNNTFLETKENGQNEINTSRSDNDPQQVNTLEELGTLKGLG